MYNAGTPQILEHLITCATVVAAELPSPSNWSPEKRLAGAVLASALVEIRDYHGDRSHCRSVGQNLEWVASDESEWPFSFVRLCQLFDLEPTWVRMIVHRWVTEPSADIGPDPRRFELPGGMATQKPLQHDSGLVCGPRAGFPADAVRTIHAALA
jgi:hypothetical protein